MTFIKLADALRIVREAHASRRVSLLGENLLLEKLKSLAPVVEVPGAIETREQVVEESQVDRQTSWTRREDTSTNARDPSNSAVHAEAAPKAGAGQSSVTAHSSTTPSTTAIEQVLRVADVEYKVTKAEIAAARIELAALRERVEFVEECAGHDCEQRNGEHPDDCYVCRAVRLSVATKEQA